MASPNMKDFEAWCSFPSAPLTSRLILRALQKSFPNLQIRTDRDIPWEVTEYRGDPGPFLQWSIYDSLSHELTLENPTTVIQSQSSLEMRFELTNCPPLFLNRWLCRLGSLLILYDSQKHNSEALSQPITGILCHEAPRLLPRHSSCSPKNVVY